MALGSRVAYPDPENQTFETPDPDPTLLNKSNFMRLSL